MGSQAKRRRWCLTQLGNGNGVNLSLRMLLRWNRANQGELGAGASQHEKPQGRIIPGGWQHEHCAICWATIARYAETHGYWSEHDTWICESCYERYVLARSIDFMEQSKTSVLRFLSLTSALQPALSKRAGAAELDSVIRPASGKCWAFRIKRARQRHGTSADGQRSHRGRRP